MTMRRAIPAGILLLLLIAGIFLVRDLREPAETVNPPPAPVESSAGDSNSFLTFVPDGPLPGNVPVLPAVTLPEASGDAIPGEYTVQFSDTGAMEAFLAQAAERGLKILGTIPELRMVRFSGTAAELASVLPPGSQLDNNYRVRAPTIPDEDLWQADNLGAFNEDALKFLGVPATPDRLSWGSGVTIAVLDTGWTGHPSVREGAVRVIDLLESGPVGEFSAHGTAVAGLIASTDPFAPGIAPGSEILSIRVLDSNGQGDAFSLAEGIIAAVNNGANVINMSLGGYSDSSVLRQAVVYATAKGVVLVAASGNDGLNRVTYPAAYPSVIGVNAIDANGNRTPFSNYGEGLDIAAPGYQVHALWEDEGFVYFDGTSASAPLVTGMVARLIQAGSASTPAGLQALIRDYANDTGLPGEDAQYGAGILSASRLESKGQGGIYDLALADLYPATEKSDGASVPLYITFQNRGTEFTPGTSVDITVNGSPYFYRLPGMGPGQVESLTVPIPLAGLNAGQPFEVTAIARIAEGFPDGQPANNGGRIVLVRQPNE